MSEDGRSFRVLVVDDDIRVADSLVQVLIASGHEAVAAYGAEAAMKLAEKLDPHAVISDVVMGPVSGVELANYIREHYPECRVLLFSGHASTREFTEAVLTRGSVVQFMPKPVRPESILSFLAAGAAREAPVQSTERAKI